MKLKQLKLYADGTAAIVDPTANLRADATNAVVYGSAKDAITDPTIELPSKDGNSAGNAKSDDPTGAAAATYTLPDGTAADLPDTTPTPEPGPEPQPEPAETTSQKILVWAKANKLWLGIAAAVLIIYIMYRRAQ